MQSQSHLELREGVLQCQEGGSCELCQPGFPDAEHVFRDIFATEDPAPLLLSILTEHPTYFTLRDLVSCYVEAVHYDPYRGQTLASSLARIIHSPHAPSFGQDRDTLRGLLSRELARTHFKDIDDSDDDITKVHGPKNTFLLDSLLSGFSFKYELTSSPDMIAFLENGLKSPHHDSSEDSKLDTELSVVGTSIQLLLSGSQITRCEFYHGWEGYVAKKLKAHEVAGTVKDPHAIEVLKLTIRHAETGFLKENDRDDVWSLLFPTKLPATSNGFTTA